MMEVGSDLESLRSQIRDIQEVLPQVSTEQRQELEGVLEQLETLVQSITVASNSQDSEETISQAIDEDEYKLFQEEIREIEEEFPEETLALSQPQSQRSTLSQGSSQTNNDSMNNTKVIISPDYYDYIDEGDEDADSEGSDSDSDIIPNSQEERPLKRFRKESKDKRENSTELEEETDEVGGVTGIQNELEALEGMKCLAPHEKAWGEVGFYPAMISGFASLNNGDADDCLTEINVKVVFLQPIVKSQLFCPFYKENRCRFEDHNCRYSHGEVVPLSKLREYNDPDYSKVIPSSRVLAKYHKDELWYKATVKRLTSDGNCEVLFDKDNKLYELGIHETAPLDELEHEPHNILLSDEDNRQADKAEEGNDEETLNLTNEFLHIETNQALGDWEKFTTGFGSKLMMKMGYIMGSGLGKKADGRVIPVDAVLVPPGMSLDHFISLKEQSQNGQSIFSVEKKLKKAQKQHAAREKQLEQQQRKSASMFDFMNNQLSLKNSSHSNKPTTSSSSSSNVLKKPAACLKKEMLKVGEDVKKLNKDIAKMKQSIKRAEGRDPTTESFMKNKLIELEKRKQELTRVEANIIKEQMNRSDKRKLTEF